MPQKIFYIVQSIGQSSGGMHLIFIFRKFHISLKHSEVSFDEKKKQKTAESVQPFWQNSDLWQLIAIYHTVARVTKCQMSHQLYTNYILRSAFAPHLLAPSGGVRASDSASACRLLLLVDLSYVARGVLRSIRKQTCVRDNGGAVPHMSHHHHFTPSRARNMATAS